MGRLQLRLLIILALLQLCVGCGRTQPERVLPTLTRIEQVWSLSGKEASRGYPVRLRGVVTFYDRSYHVLTVQDATAGVLVDTRDIDSTEPPPGSVLEVEGWTGFDEAAPLVVKPHLQIVGRAVLPAATRVNLRDILSDALDYQRVEVTASVTNITTLENAHVRLGLADGTDVIDLYLNTQIYVNPAIIGSRIKARGVPYTIHDSAGHARAARLYVADYRDIDTSGIELASKPEPPGPSGRSDQPLSTAQSVKQLTPVEAARSYPVKLRGVVNKYEPSYGALFIQDATAGIYVSLASDTKQEFPVGSLVEVSGRTDPGDFAPTVADATATVLGPGRMFPPLHVRNPDDLAMSDENLWVRVQGTARHIGLWHEYGVRIELNTAGRPFTVLLTAEENPRLYAHWIDAEMSIDGVLVPLYDRFRHLRGFTVMCPGERFVRVTRPAPALDSLGDPRPLVTVHQFRVGGESSHRVKVAGTITGVWRDSTATISDGRYGLKLRAAANVPLEIGDTVEANGFLPFDGFEPALEYVNLRKTGHRQPEQPRDRDAAEVLVGADSATLVRVEGLLTNQERVLGDEILTLRAGKTGFTAVIEQPQPSPFLASLRKGSVLRVTGVCVMDWDRSETPPEPIRFQLRMRSPKDIEVLQMASWWTPQRTLSLLAGLTVVLTGALGWALSLKMQVRRQTAVIAARAEHAAQLEAQLAHAQRLESVGRLAGGIAHDFNNLLTVINGYSELLMSQAGLNHTVRVGLAEIAKAGKKATSLIQQILAFSRRQMLQPVVLNLNDVVREMEEMLRRVLGAQILFATNLDPQLGLVKADSGQMHQVLMNLAVNARDAMPDGGTLLIETSNLEIAESFVEEDEEVAPGAYVVISVSDTGSGMDSKTLQRIFEPFFTTKPVGQGTGLGLSMVFGIVKQSGGHLHAKSQPGKGSMFEIRLPRLPRVQ